jgi:hypothetical protein
MAAAVSAWSQKWANDGAWRASRNRRKPWYALLPILAASFKESQWKRLNCSPAPQLQIDSPIADKQKTEEDLLTYSALSLSLPLAVGPHQ